MKKDHRLHLDYAFRFGQPLVFDLGQEYEMNISESSSFVKQMREVYTLNRAQWEPFNIHLCNYNAESQGMKVSEVGAKDLKRRPVVSGHYS